RRKDLIKFTRALFTFWVVFFVGLLAVTGVAQATVTGNGVLFYGDTTNAGILRDRVFTNSATFAAEINGTTGSASNIAWTVAKTAPTREEIMIGDLKID